MNTNAPLSKHRETSGSFFRSQWGWLFFGGLALALAIFFALVPIKEGRIYGYITAAVLGVAAVGFLITAFVQYARLVKYVALYSDRVEWRVGGRTRSAAWEDITSVWRAEVRVNNILTRREVTIKAGRDRATFTYVLSNWKAMADAIQGYTHPHLWAAAVNDFNAGEKVRFSKDVAVSGDGITVEGKTTRWEDVRKMMVHNGSLIVFGGRGRELYAPLADTPNYHILLSLLEHCPVRPE